MNTIDERRVRERIDNFIQNDGQTNIYVEAPSQEAIAKILHGRYMDEEVNLGPISSLIISKPSTIMTGLHLPGIARAFWRTKYQLERIGLEGEMITSLARTWMSARHYERHPEDNPRGLRRLFLPRFWFQSPQEYLDKLFLEYSQKAYDWLQEERPLEQSDLKNMHAIVGLYLLDRYNEAHPTTARKAPLDEFVAEQIRKVPNGIIEGLGSGGKGGGVKWVNGESSRYSIDCRRARIE